MSMDNPPQDEFNPYASPKAELRYEPDTLHFRGMPLRFDVGDILSRTWAIYQARMGKLIGLVMAWIVLSFVGIAGIAVIQEVAGGLVGEDSFGSALLGLLLFFATIVAVNWLYLGQTVVMLRVARDEDGASIGGLFSGGPAVIRWIIASVVMGLLFLPILLLYVVPVLIAAGYSRGDPTILFLVATPAFFLSWLLAVALTIRLSPAVFLVVEGAGPIEVIFQSMRLTKGRFWPLVLIYLLVMVINMVGSMALLIGLIFTVPFTMLLLAVTYSAMAGPPAGKPKTQPMLDPYDGVA